MEKIQTTDYAVPRRMSKSAFVVICYNSIKQYMGWFFLIFVLQFFDANKQVSFIETISKQLLFIGGLLVLAIVSAFVNYYYKKFYVKDGNLIFMHGFFHRETTSIPVYKIHSMRTKRGVLYRMLDMKGVSFDTLASKSEEIELILDDADWEALLQLVEAQEQLLKEEDVKQSSHEVSPKDSLETQVDVLTVAESEAHLAEDHVEQKSESYPIENLNFSNFNLIKGAMCQNHLKGMAILGSALLAFYGKIADIGEKTLNYALDYVETHTSMWSFTATTVAFAICCMYLIVMLLWIGKIFLRYFNMEVRMNQQQLFFESGLLTRLSCQFSYDKVCTVYVKQNILEKWMKCSTINLKQAFNATDEKNESDVRIYGSNSANRFLDWWLGKDYAASKDVITAHSGKGVLGYTIKQDLMITLVTIAALIYLELYAWMVIPMVYLLISFAKGICAVHRSCISLKDDYVRIDSGKFANIHNYIKYNSIEVVKLVRTPFTPYFHRINLIVATNGTSFVVRSLKENEAKAIYEILLCYCRN